MSAPGVRRGRNRELDWIAFLREHGWTALRVDGAGDVVAGKAGETWLIQVKSTRRPYERFGPAERARLLAETDGAGWRAALLHWPKGVGITGTRFVPSEDWP